MDRSCLVIGPGTGTGSCDNTTGDTSENRNNNTKRQQQLHQLNSEQPEKSTNNLETFVDTGVSVVRIGSGINRSVSNVGTRLRTRVPKPVRRSKSHLTGGKYVTNITHGGSVTLVRLNSQDQAREFQPIEPDTTTR